jgi:hypothetical protein
MAIGNQAKTHPPTIRAALSEKRRQPEALLEHIGEDDDVIIGMFNSKVSVGSNVPRGGVSDHDQATPGHTATRASCSNPTTTMARGTRYR